MLSEVILRQFLRPFRRVTPIALFLLGTLVLAGWLGYQALDAARSHRRTAEAVLSDYARIAATEMARVIDGQVDDVLDEVFAPVSFSRLMRRGIGSAEILWEEMSEAMDDERCECPGFRKPVALFRATNGGRDVEVIPDSLPADLVDALVTRTLAAPKDGRRTHGLLVMDRPFHAGNLAVGYNLIDYDLTDDLDIVYGFVVDYDALAELLGTWYANNPLLPAPIAGGEPNDSLLHVAVNDPRGRNVFASPVGFPTPLSASAEVREEYGDLTVVAAVRPDAASRLVIGGLPRSRLPLLTMLLLLTLGVGVAAGIQIRREQAFQHLRDDFVSGVSHELRTPLAQIRMFAELQQAGKLPSDVDRMRATSVIHREAVRLSHLVENILQFSRLQRMPEQRLPKEQLNFADAIADGVDAITPLLHDRGMTLEVVAERDLIVVANRDALTRIVVNLLDNAAKYGPPGQTVRIDVEQVDGSAKLAVSDEGPGVPVPERERIWKAYRRLERDVKAQIPGTGIGLSVVADLAAQHGGRAWVDQSDTGGARFAIEIPLALATEEPDPDLEA